MKKLICTLLALTLTLAMTACGGKQPTETTARRQAAYRNHRSRRQY